MSEYKYFLHITIAIFLTVFPPLAYHSMAESPAVTNSPSPSPSASEANGDIVNMPIITDIRLANDVERANAKVSLRGKNLLPSKGSAVVTFAKAGGGTVSASIFIETSSSLLLFRLPVGVVTGDVTVKVTGENGTTMTSAPYHFDFHQPKILFITGEDGIGAGKTIRIWGEYLDGVYFREGGKTKILPIDSAFLQGAEVGLNGAISTIDIELPKGDFDKDFYVERGCDESNENCLKSNIISFAQVRPPIITQITVDYASRLGTVFGKNFPESEEDFKIDFAGISAIITSYFPDKGKAIFTLPCPLPYMAKVTVKNKDVESNPLLFVPKDAPGLLGLNIIQAENADNRDIEVSFDRRINIPVSTDCAASDLQLLIGSKAYPLTDFGGKLTAKNIPFSKIPASGSASIVMSGIQSKAIDFGIEKFSPDPFIYRIESKYGFRPGAPFLITGRNLGNSYKACDVGSTTISGPSIYYEEQLEYLFGYDSEGNEIFKTKCNPIPPKVTPSLIEAQFTGLGEGKQSKASKVSLSVRVGSKESNKIEFNFGDNSQNVAYSPPEIRAVEFPHGRNTGDEIIIRGANFGVQVNQNIVKFGSATATVLRANLRGTELAVKIPEAAGSEIIVTRTIPDIQASEAFSVSLSSEPDEKLEFRLESNAGAVQQIEIDHHKEKVTVATMNVVNSIGDLKTGRFRLTMRYTDGVPEDEYSVAKLKIVPVADFRLKLNGKAVSESAVAQVGNGAATIEFLPFVLPLTKTATDVLTVETDILPFVTDNSEFSITFAPQQEVNFQAVNTDNAKGIRPSNKTQLEFPKVKVKKLHDDTCIDTDKSNINCENYFHLMEMKNKTALSSQQQVTATPVPEFKVHRQKRIDMLLTDDRMKDFEEKLRLAREEKIAKIARRSGPKVAEKLQIILEAKDYSTLLSHKLNMQKTNTAKIETRLSDIEATKNVRRAQEAEILQKKIPLKQRIKGNRTDSDQDGLPDEEEQLIGTAPDNADTDGDKISDFLEMEYGFSPFSRVKQAIFSDLANTGSATNTITSLYMLGIITGYEDGTFKGSAPASRAQFVSALARAFFGTNLDQPKTSLYPDVQGDEWFAPELQAAKNARLLDSEADIAGNFRPHLFIKRIEACRLALKFATIDPTKDTDSTIALSDVAPNDTVWANKCLQERLLILSDKEKNLFAPDKILSRAEMAVLVFRVVRAKK